MSRLTQAQMSLYRMGQVAQEDEPLAIIAYKTGGYRDVRHPNFRNDVFGYMDRKILGEWSRQSELGGDKPLRTENTGDEYYDWYLAAKEAWWLEVEAEQQGTGGGTMWGTTGHMLYCAQAGWMCNMW